MYKLLFVIAFVISLENVQAQHRLIIQFDKALTTSGNLLVYIYDKSKGFPKEKDKIFRKEIFEIHQTTEIIINDLPFGTYAIVVVLDANKNKKMDRNFLGMPAEKYALSGQPKFHFGPPRFDEIKFDFRRNNQILNLQF